MKAKAAWQNSMEASLLEFNKNMEKALDLILKRICVSENWNCLGKFGVEFQADKWTLVINKSLFWK
jgi:hypothetical protein